VLFRSHSLALSGAEFAGAFLGACLVSLHYLPHFTTLPEPPASTTDELLLRRHVGVGVGWDGGVVAWWAWEAPRAAAFKPLKQPPSPCPAPYALPTQILSTCNFPPAAATR